MYDEWSNPYQQHQNGVVEHMVHVLTQKTRVFLLQSGLGSSYWSFALAHAVNVYNHLPHSSLPGNTAPILRAQRRPFLQYLRAFGCHCTVLKNDISDKHMTTHGEFAVYLGAAIQNGSKGILLYTPHNGRVEITTNCKFDESLFPARTFDQRYHPDSTEQFHVRVSSNFPESPFPHRPSRSALVTFYRICPIP